MESAKEEIEDSCEEQGEGEGSSPFLVQERRQSITGDRSITGNGFITTLLAAPHLQADSSPRRRPRRSRLRLHLPTLTVTPQPQSNLIVVAYQFDGQSVNKEQSPSPEWQFEALCVHLYVDLFDPS
ncbi:hypothetical protein BC936DRAFT_142506 [Jimgerdemannia flammicorona]|uniref:Uncharacterized protein n=1 Tax=Jimgerdemannia flammicorona TaxID=994334 RepID=A0A433A0G7_9FUNG|nr:hypothetical protein BC936DRAFT_142506 [Jimgerdemannia flammicorona]